MTARQLLDALPRGVTVYLHRGRLLMEGRPSRATREALEARSEEIKTLLRYDRARAILATLPPGVMAIPDGDRLYLRYSREKPPLGTYAMLDRYRAEALAILRGKAPGTREPKARPVRGAEERLIRAWLRRIGRTGAMERILAACRADPEILADCLLKAGPAARKQPPEGVWGVLRRPEA